MAQYKVPQDVEADDKLLGPFGFRQFVYLMIAGFCIAIAFALFQIFPLLAIIPLPIIVFFAALALPLKKDQPMETYLAAVASFYLKPHNRFWMPGQRNTTIKIEAPKIVEGPRVKEISENEAEQRLSFLSELVDTEGRSITGDTFGSSMRPEYVAEADNTPDMFDALNSPNLNYQLNQSTIIQQNAATATVQQAINNPNPPQIKHDFTYQPTTNPAAAAAPPEPTPLTNKIVNSTTSEPQTQSQTQPQPQVSQTPPAQPTEDYADVIVRPGDEPVKEDKDAKVKSKIESAAESELAAKEEQEKLEKSASAKALKDGMIELAHNADYSIETISKEANRLKKKSNEVYIALH